jgi:hypothetical protein
MTDWRRRLNDLILEKHPSSEIPEIPRKPYYGDNGENGTKTSPGKRPPLDVHGAPCGLCPSCGQGEFWRWPKFHAQHDPADWRCCFCDPIPHGSGPVDFCGVPDRMLVP